MDAIRFFFYWCIFYFLGFFLPPSTSQPTNLRYEIFEVGPEKKDLQFTKPEENRGFSFLQNKK